MSDIVRQKEENMQTYTLNIRPRRQATFPKELLKQLDLEVGDKLIASTEGKKLILKPQKQIALEALAEIQRIFKESGIPEKEIQENLQKIRQENYDKKYS